MLSYILRSCINKILPETLPTPGGFIRLQKPSSFTLVQAQTQMINRCMKSSSSAKVRGSVAGVKLKHHRRSVGSVGGGEIRETENLFKEIVGWCIGRMIRHNWKENLLLLLFSLSLCLFSTQFVVISFWVTSWKWCFSSDTRHKKGFRFIGCLVKLNRTLLFIF